MDLIEALRDAVEFVDTALPLPEPVKELHDDPQHYEHVSHLREIAFKAVLDRRLERS